MTPDTRGLRPLSFHDNMVGAQEKMQCTELEASIQAMKWPSELRMSNMGPLEWQRNDTEELSAGACGPLPSHKLLGSQLSASPHGQEGCYTQIQSWLSCGKRTSSGKEGSRNNQVCLIWGRIKTKQNRKTGF